MEYKYYKIHIDSTARNHLKAEPELFNSEEIMAKSRDDVLRKLIDRYGKLPSRKNKIYHDYMNGSVEEIGFTHSFWNRDYSHAGEKSWYQTDWITALHVTEVTTLV